MILSKITPAWLTALPTRRGSLIAGSVLHGSMLPGSVLHVEQSRDPNPITHNASLLLTCSPNAQDACPDRLFFKHGSRAAEAKLY